MSAATRHYCRLAGETNYHPCMGREH
jgi:hypothetical protein